MSGITIPNGRIAVNSPLTYRLNGDASYFQDLFHAQVRNDRDALSRLDRHEREVRGELPKLQLERRGSSTLAPEGTKFEYRAPSLQLGQGGYGVPPLWAIELTATAPRPHRVVSDLIGSLPLPSGVSSVNVPRIVVGTSVSQQTPNTPTSDTDYTDAATTSAVTTVSGHSDVPLQMLEQSPIGQGHLDQVLWRDLTSAYDADLETMLLTGTGGNAPLGEPLGLLNVPGTNTITYNSGSPSATSLYPFFGTAFGSVSDTRKIHPQAWVMRGGRHAWIASSEDASSRPLEVPLTAGSMIANPTLPNPISGVIGLPVFLSEAIPTTLGTATNQDVVVAFRHSDCLLWESEPRLNVFTQVLSGSLMARIQFRGYVAAILGRYPSAIATITGTGMVVPTNE